MFCLLGQLRDLINVDVRVNVRACPCAQVEARLAGQVSQLKLPDSPSGSISSACKRPTYPLERMPAGAPVASVGA